VIENRWTWLRTLLRDERFIRAAIIGVVALVVLGYLGRVTGIIAATRLSREVKPALIVIPTPPSIEPAADDDILFPGETVRGTLAAGELNAWVFSAAEGEIVDLVAQPVGVYDSSFDLVLELFDPEGKQMAKVDQGVRTAPEILRGLELATTGDYTIWVSEIEFDHTGSYALTLLTDRIKRSHPLRLGVGQTLHSRIHADETQFWVFSADADHQLSLSLITLEDSDAQFTSQLELFGPDGSFVTRATADNPGDPIIVRGLPVENAGDFTIWVSDKTFEHDGHFALSAQFTNSKLDLDVLPAGADSPTPSP
jgi:hypothetical protein